MIVLRPPRDNTKRVLISTQKEIKESEAGEFVNWCLMSSIMLLLPGEYGLGLEQHHTRCAERGTIHTIQVGEIVTIDGKQYRRSRRGKIEGLDMEFKIIM